ncbi:hypothetical protein J5N97_004921 [Dioscorea zingiberensis]|uniref:W2 domain-containing protein n=1 Tax=Dioscorea zingiberensis TaxID=325984 RepID=A0A9D5HRD7_9LILI|nr:hypothetical protein J5N97_004921 [Dioscorea zingiberensis]
MALQNIGASNSDDAFYRYKMPKMITKIEGRGNGIKTNIVNMVDIAKALARPASYTTKFFGCELGAQSKFDEKSGVSLVNGAHDTAKLAGLLENFIKKYVQCYGCGNPGNGDNYHKESDVNPQMCCLWLCIRCGYERQAYNIHSGRILQSRKREARIKTMRRAEKERLKEGEAADEEQKKLKKEMKKKGVVAQEGIAPKGTTTKKKATGSDEEHSSPVGGQIGDNEVAEDDDDDNDIQWQADTSLEAARQRIEEQLSAVTAEMVMLSSTTKPDQEEKPKKEPKCEARNNGEDIASKKPVTPGNLVKVIKDNFEKGCTPSEIGSFLTSLTATPQEVMVALFEFLFEGVGKGFAKEVGKKKNYLAAAMTDEGSQMLLLHSIEAFCGKCNAGGSEGGGPGYQISI